MIFFTLGRYKLKISFQCYSRNFRWYQFKVLSSSTSCRIIDVIPRQPNNIKRILRSLKKMIRIIGKESNVAGVHLFTLKSCPWPFLGFKVILPQTHYLHLLLRLPYRRSIKPYLLKTRSRQNLNGIQSRKLPSKILMFPAPTPFVAFSLYLSQTKWYHVSTSPH